MTKKKFKIPAFLFCEVRNSAENRLGKNLKYIHKYVISIMLF